MTAAGVKPTASKAEKPEDKRTYIVYTDANGDTHRMLRDKYHAAERDGSL